jgi:hypothetical protein
VSRRVYRYWAVTERRADGGWKRTIFRDEAAARAYAAQSSDQTETYEFPCYRERGALIPVNQPWR